MMTNESTVSDAKMYLSFVTSVERCHLLNVRNGPLCAHSFM